jgi:hypothetical protein
LTAAENGAVFAVTTTTVQTSDNPFELQGTAPFAVATLKINNVWYPVTWSTVTDWKAAVRLTATINTFTVTAHSRTGTLLGTAVATVTYMNGTPPYPTDGLLINEWMADNASTLLNPKTDDYSDWIELYNKGMKAFDASGYQVRDSGTTTFTFPAGTVIPPGGFVLVWADDSTSQQGPDAEDNFHAPFRLSSSGETISLRTPAGTTFDSRAYGALAADQSGGRLGDGLSYSDLLSKPTPRRPNPNP